MLDIMLCGCGGRMGAALSAAAHAAGCSQFNLRHPCSAAPGAQALRGLLCMLFELPAHPLLPRSSVCFEKFLAHARLYYTISDHSGEHVFAQNPDFSAPRG